MKISTLQEMGGTEFGSHMWEAGGDCQCAPVPPAPGGPVRTLRGWSGPVGLPLEREASPQRAGGEGRKGS
ncbi:MULTISPECIES: hypothetical protein [unclassified Sulfitobacter]|uniref:hypothetical protein n=1 Tax=unclassified Sulfitobacter TaxID=196795 RepID=UPI0007C2F302|nr:MULTISPECIES: hypothetical protein [unclassified Sulfitobacter]KZY04887.1 hypothetical protein A3721_15615 [Sulfitobacter sp. HI0023]